MLNEGTCLDFTVHQEHEYFSIFVLRKEIAINCVLPTRVFLDN
jgi:hypothetical protein